MLGKMAVSHTAHTKNDTLFLEFSLTKYIISLTNTRMIRPRISNSITCPKEITKEKTKDLCIKLFM